jgi:nucleoside-diphosphate-sugar epimerase
MKAAIVGVSGFLGAHLARRLVRQGNEAIGYDVRKASPDQKLDAFHQLDLIGDTPKLPSGIDALFFLAQSPYYRRFPERADHLFGVNAYGAIKVARVARECGVRAFFYASSGNVYAPSFKALREDDPVRRDNAYALSKLAAEETLELLHGPMAFVAIRFFGLFGPGHQSMLPATIVERVRSGREVYLEPSPVEPRDKGGLRVSFLYVRDAVHGLLRLAELAVAGVPLPARLNVAGPEPISVRRFGETVGNILGKKPKFSLDKYPRKYDLIADISQLRTLINPAFTPFEEAAARSYSAQLMILQDSKE